MTEQFHTLFCWGFFLGIPIIAMNLISLLYAATEKDVVFKIGRCMLYPLGFASIAYLIAWIVLRYREIGRICSGDYVQADETGVTPYAWKSGYFLHIVVMITMWLLIAVCACSCCVGIAIGVMQARR